MSLDLGLSKSEELLQKSATDFMQRGVPRETLEDLLVSDTGYTDTMLKKIKEMGWFGITIPEEYGGEGYPLTSAGILFETLGSAPLPGPYFTSGILSSQIIMEAATEEQKQELLPEVAKGNLLLTLALTEADYGWTAESISTSASEKNGEFVLNGIKLFTPEAEAANHFIVVARTTDKTESNQGLSIFLVDKAAKGVSVRRLSGFLAGRSFELRFDNVKVQSSSLLGEKDCGWLPLEQAIMKATPVLCAYKAGGCQSVFDIALTYSRERVQFGQPIGRFQRVQDMIIEMVDFADSARWTTYEALWKLDSNKPTRECQEAVHMAKAVASESYWQICTMAHRVLSGISYSKEHTISFHTRTSRALYHFLGEPAHHRQRLAQMILG